MKMSDRAAKRLVLIAFMFSGASALVYEVVWTRALSLLLGSTVYALSTMLATFMAGLALGSFFGGRLCDRRHDHLFMFALCELVIGVAGMASIPLIYKLPPLYLSLYRSFHFYPQVFLMVQAGLCALVMLVPTVMMGGTFPLVSRVLTRGIDEMGTGVGNAYFANTLGAVVGSVSAGFIMIPLFGIKATTFGAAGLNLLAALVVFLLSKKRIRSVAAIVPLLFFSAVSLARAVEPFSGINFYSAMRFKDEKLPFKVLNEVERRALKELYHGEYAEGTVKAFRAEDGSLILQVGGKVEGTSKYDLANTVLLSYLPLAAHPEPHSFLTVGLGAGVTLGAAKDHLRDVDLVEINPGVIEAVRRHGPAGLLDNVEIIRNDARNYLLATEKRYDIISSEPSYPSESSVVNLFTRDFYRIAAQRLTDGGVYCQWLPYQLLANEDVDMMLATFASVFPHVYVWKVNATADLIMVGSRSPFRINTQAMAERVTSLNIHGYPIDYVLSRTPGQVREFLKHAKTELNTDDRPLLEYSIINTIIRGEPKW